MNTVNPISRDEANAWIEAYGSAWINRDPDRIVRIFTDDASYREHRFKPGAEGVAAIRSYWDVIVREAQRDVAFEVQQVVVAGDQAFVHWTARFVWLPINGIMELDGMARVSFVVERRDGIRLARVFEEWLDIREA